MWLVKKKMINNDTTFQKDAMGFVLFIYYQYLYPGTYSVGTYILRQHHSIGGDGFHFRKPNLSSRSKEYMVHFRINYRLAR